MTRLRQKPNILITGTPGVGKSTHCEALSKALNLAVINVNQVVVDNVCHDGWSKEHESFMVDEDKVIATRTKMNILRPRLMCFLAFRCTGRKGSGRWCHP